MCTSCSVTISTSMWLVFRGTCSRRIVCTEQFSSFDLFISHFHWIIMVISYMLMKWNSTTHHAYMVPCVFDFLCRLSFVYTIQLPRNSTQALTGAFSVRFCVRAIIKAERRAPAHPSNNDKCCVHIIIFVYDIFLAEVYYVNNISSGGGVCCNNFAFCSFQLNWKISRQSLSHTCVVCRCVWVFFCICRHT